MKIKLLKDGKVQPHNWPGKTGDIFDVNPRDVSQNIDSGLAELYTPEQSVTLQPGPDSETEPEPDDLSSRPED